MNQIAPIRLPDGMEYVDAAYVVARLEEAGKTLLCLKVHGTRPAGYRVAWPEMAKTILEARDPEDQDTRFPVPSAAAITAMDEVFPWVALVGERAVYTRRLIWARMLVHPLKDRHVWSWKRLEKSLGLSYETLRLRHGRGIDRIITRLNDPGFREKPGGGLP